MKNNIYKSKILKAINKLLKSGNIPQTSPQYTRLEKTKIEVKNNNYSHVTKKIINFLDVKKDSKRVQKNIEKVKEVVNKDNLFINSYNDNKPKSYNYDKKPGRARTEDGLPKWLEVNVVKLNNGEYRNIATEQPLDKTDVIAYRNELQRRLTSQMLQSRLNPNFSTSPNNVNMSSREIESLYITSVEEVWE